MTETLKDRRLIRLVSSLTRGTYAVLSVDIFDTLLWRRVPEPKDMLYLVGKALAADGLMREFISPVEFAQLRESAEKGAQAVREQSTGSREILLSDIYDALPRHIWWDTDGPRLAADTEVDLEAESMILDRDVAALLDQAVESGVRVILTSDTYFSRPHLLRFLKAAGLETGRIPETLYISNEQNRPKWRDLFDVVLNDLDVSAEQLVHVGDNVDADVAPCAARGIPYVFYDKWAALPRAQTHELSASRKIRSDWLLEGGDGGLTGLRSRLGHRVPQSVPSGQEPYWSYGAVVLAPVFAAYGRWVVDEVSGNGSGAVFGIMREGRFLNRVVDLVAERLGKPIETKELWLSRRAVVRAALWPDDFSYLAQAITYCPGPTTDDILTQLGLSPRDDLSDTFIDPAKVDLHAPGGLEALLTAESQSQALQNKIAEQSQRRRQALLDYLKDQADIENQEAFCLLDVVVCSTWDIVSSGSVLGNLVIIPDLGVGFDERRQIAVPLALSPLGRGELEFSVKPFGPEAYESLKITLPKAKAALRVDNCSVVYRGDGQTADADVTPAVTLEGMWIWPTDWRWSARKEQMCLSPWPKRPHHGPMPWTYGSASRISV